MSAYPDLAQRPSERLVSALRLTSAGLREVARAAALTRVSVDEFMRHMVLVLPRHPVYTPHRAGPRLRFKARR